MHAWIWLVAGLVATAVACGWALVGIAGGHASL